MPGAATFPGAEASEVESIVFWVLESTQVA